MDRADTERFRQCFDEHWSAVCRCLARRGAGAQTEDLAAEAFAIGWGKWHQVPVEPLPWLLRTALNLLANARRKDTRRQMVERLESDTPATADGYVRAASRETTQAVLEALAGLRDADREALLLVAWDGLSSSQAAFVCGCSPGAFRVRLHRARTVLRAVLGADPRCTIQEISA